MKESKGGERDHGNIEQSMMPTVALWNANYQRIRIVFLNTFANIKDSDENSNEKHYSISYFILILL
jgi:hypothetical protein